MKISNEAAELFAAMSKMQEQLRTVGKEKQGHGYSYADLASCLSEAKKPLADNGLAVSQMMGCKDGQNTLITMLTHSSGQYICSEFIMEKAILHGGAGKNPAQAMGASITYMRRYAFAAIVGLAQEDTDAKGVRDRQQEQGSGPQQSQGPQQGGYGQASEPITDGQVKWLQAFYSRNAEQYPDRDARLASLSKWCQREITSMKDMTKSEAHGLIDAIENQG